jgi:hypothetical protein
MGWLFSSAWLERKDLIKHLVEGNGIKTLKHCTVGNNLWCVHEIERRPGVICRFICLYMMKGPHNCGKGYEGYDKDFWGYKDVDETMGPCETSCPVSYLEMCTAPEGTYAYEWRQRVYARGRNARALKIGSKWKVGERIAMVIKRRSPNAFLIELDGTRYRCGIDTLLGREAV